MSDKAPACLGKLPTEMLLHIYRFCDPSSANKLKVVSRAMATCYHNNHTLIPKHEIDLVVSREDDDIIILFGMNYEFVISPNVSPDDEFLVEVGVFDLKKVAELRNKRIKIVSSSPLADLPRILTNLCYYAQDATLEIVGLVDNAFLTSLVEGLRPHERDNLSFCQAVFDFTDQNLWENFLDIINSSHLCFILCVFNVPRIFQVSQWKRKNTEIQFVGNNVISLPSKLINMDQTLLHELNAVGEVMHGWNYMVLPLFQNVVFAKLDNNIVVSADVIISKIAAWLSGRVESMTLILMHQIGDRPHLLAYLDTLPGNKVVTATGRLQFLVNKKGLVRPFMSLAPNFILFA